MEYNEKWEVRYGWHSRVPSITQLLQGSSGAGRSHLHFDLRHWSQAVWQTYQVSKGIVPGIAIGSNSQQRVAIRSLGHC